MTELKKIDEGIEVICDDCGWCGKAKDLRQHPVPDSHLQSCHCPECNSPHLNFTIPH